MSFDSPLAVSYGAGVRGRVVKNGRPLSGIAVNMDQQNRDAAQWVGTSSATTNETGQFLIANVLPQEPMVIVASSETLGPLGCVPSRQLTTGADARPQTSGTWRCVLVTGSRAGSC